MVFFHVLGALLDFALVESSAAAVIGELAQLVPMLVLSLQQSSLEEGTQIRPLLKAVSSLLASEESAPALGPHLQSLLTRLLQVRLSDGALDLWERNPGAQVAAATSLAVPVRVEAVTAVGAVCTRFPSLLLQPLKIQVSSLAHLPCLGLLCFGADGAKFATSVRRWEASGSPGRRRDAQSLVRLSFHASWGSQSRSSGGGSRAERRRRWEGT